MQIIRTVTVDSHLDELSSTLTLYLIILLFVGNDASPFIQETDVQSLPNETAKDFVSPCRYKNDSRLIDGVVVDCSNLGLTTVSASWFPPSTTGIRLNGNRLVRLNNSTFRLAIRLRFLILEGNYILEIPTELFKGLHELEELNLADNELCLDTLNGYIFSDLKNLRTLRLDSNDNDCQESSGKYPKHLLKGLTKVKTLSLHTLPGDLDFGDLFQDLSNLTSLTLTGDVSTIKNESFTGFEKIPLESISIHHVPRLKVTEADAFCPLVRIQSFSLKNANQGVEEAFHGLCALQRRNITSMTFDSITSAVMLPFAFRTSAILDRKKALYLSKICVKHFRLIDSQVFVIEPGVFTSQTWVRCIVSIDLKGNPILGEKGVIPQSKVLTKLRSLTIKDCRYRIFERHSSTRNVGGSLNSHSSQGRTNINTTQLDQVWSSSLEWQSKESRDSNTDLDMGVITYPLPPNLEIMTYAGCSNSLGKIDKIIDFKHANKLRYVYLSDNGMEAFVGRLIGIPNVEYIDLSYNDGSVMAPTFFDTMPKLKTVKLAWMKLNQSVTGLFSNLVNLENLDLSFNELYEIDSKSLRKSPHLKEIDLSGNKFTNIPLDLSGFTDLRKLDMTRNSITFLTDSDTESLELYNKRSSDLTVSLDGNPFLCDCSQIKFLAWLSSTTVKLDKNGDYQCLTENGASVVTTKTLMADLEALWRVCNGRTAFFVSLNLWLIVILVFILIYHFNRFKTLILATFWRLFVPNIKLMKKNDYQYGVFLSYADEDYRFACFDLRRFIEENLETSTYIRDRDLLPSYDMAQSIVDAVNSSWRVVFVITPDFLKLEDWVFFTVKTAVYSISPLNPKRIILIADSNIINDIPKILLRVVPEENIIEMDMPFQLGYEQQEDLTNAIS